MPKTSGWRHETCTGPGCQLLSKPHVLHRSCRYCSCISCCRTRLLAENTTCPAPRHNRPTTAGSQTAGTLFPSPSSYAPSISDTSPTPLGLQTLAQPQSSATTAKSPEHSGRAYGRMLSPIYAEKLKQNDFELTSIALHTEHRDRYRKESSVTILVKWWLQVRPIILFSNAMKMLKPISDDIRTLKPLGTLLFQFLITLGFTRKTAPHLYRSTGYQCVRSTIFLTSTCAHGRQLLLPRELSLGIPCTFALCVSRTAPAWALSCRMWSPQVLVKSAEHHLACLGPRRQSVSRKSVLLLRYRIQSLTRAGECSCSAWSFPWCLTIF